MILSDPRLILEHMFAWKFVDTASVAPLDVIRVALAPTLASPSGRRVGQVAGREGNQ